MKRHWSFLVPVMLLAVFVLTTISEAANARVAAGSFHTMLLKTDGRLWAWGDNSSGQRGNDTTTNKSSSTQVGTGTDWAAAYNPEVVAACLKHFKENGYKLDG